METLCQPTLLTTNPLGKALELWQESDQEMPESHEAEAKEEAEGAAKVGHQGVQAVDSCLSRHLFIELSNVTDLMDYICVYKRCISLVNYSCLFLLSMGSSINYVEEV